MNKIKNVLSRALCLLLSFGMSSQGFAASALSTPEVTVVCPNPSNIQNTPYVKTLSEHLKKLGAKTVKCTSCYRSPEDQRRTCRSVCRNVSRDKWFSSDPGDGCHNICAPPGRSQHQKINIATCDLGGMPANGCWSLKKLCDEKYGSKCGVGGYGGGAYHFGVNDYRFSRWGTCGGLKAPPGNYPPMGQDADPTPATPGASEIEAEQQSSNHELLIVAAVALAGGAALLWYKNRK